MFRNKMFDLTRTLDFFSNVLGQVKACQIYGRRVNQWQPLHRKDREALRRIEFNRAMAMAYAPRLQQAIH